MSITVGESTFPERATQGGLIDDVGGVATVILAIFGLIGIEAPIMAVIATIMFGITLLIQGNGMMSEYARFSVLLGGKSLINGFAASSRSAVILLGGGGIALGVLSLLDFDSAVLTPIASILFGSSLVLSSVSVWHLNVLRRATKGEESSRDILANQMAFDSAGIQIFGGFAAVVLGILAASGTRNDLTFNLVALLILGTALVLKGGSLNAILLSFMRSTSRRV
ncbi:hypothetical protein D1O30_15465 [Methylocystis hirsuta]|uniref:Uncharacterized protein n=2 Tax=Methylocystis hirsuta TaxID=369798 RepID=A0A3M9XUP4_9HYPH|nr:hypothetical protein [Methylocystis hirsuta]RNJ50778.1 hypothetical protein D1O30_15465 [Methylocystis hirsuta]